MDPGPEPSHPSLISPMLEILIATGNPHKVEEMEALFGRLLPAGSIQLRSLKDIAPKTSEPAETGSTFEANATIKAVSYAHQTGMLCLADDSGLEIDALGGKPGVISSHYCTDGRETGMTRPQRDAANNQRVLRELEGVPIEHRTARFVCIMALAAPDNPSWIRAFQAPPPPTTKHPPSTDGPVHLVRGVFEGRIGIPPSVPRGEHGFGYDPLFLVGPEFTATSAELSSEEKNARSHRGAAAVEMARLLKQMISG